MPDRLAALHEASGKVRELYSFGEEMLLVASDRMSAFDVVMPTLIPDKGRVLTGLSRFWFGRTASIVSNHMISTDQADFPSVAHDKELAGRAMLVRRLTMLPVECVVRGYLAGSGWKDYRATGSVCGHSLPSGLRESDRLPQPIFTPATKATSGHDINIDRSTATLLVGEERFQQLERVSLDLYEVAAAYALERGIIIADTKFEFGIDPAGEVVLGDEVLTPDSSRFWPADVHSPGGPQRLVRQTVRPRLVGDTRVGQGPARPGASGRCREGYEAALYRGVRAAHRRALRRLPTRDGSGYVTMNVTVLVRPREGILDPQGEAVRRSLAGLGYPATDVRAGKVFDLQVDAGDEQGALAIAGEIAEKVLSNPLIESYDIEVGQA